MHKLFRWPLAVIALAFTTMIGLGLIGTASAASASLTGDAETGDISAFAGGSNANVSATALAAYHGAYGYHFDSGGLASDLNWNSTAIEQNHEYFSVSAWVKVDTPPSGTTMAVFSIKNVSGVNNFDLFLRADGTYQWDLQAANTQQQSQAAFANNTWHLIEADGYYGASTYTADVEIDGVPQTSIASTGQTVSSVKSAWFGVATSGKTFTMDMDDIRLDVSETALGFNGNAPASAYNATGCK